MRVFILTELFHPISVSTGYYLTEIAAGLAEKYETIAIVRNVCGAVVEEKYRGVKVRRVGVAATRESCLWIRALYSAYFSVCALWNVVARARTGDVVVAVTNPPFLPAVCALASMLTRSPLVVLLHDVYPQAAIAAGVIRDRGVRARICHGIQRWTLKKAGSVICIGRDMRDLVLGEFGLDETKVSVIPNWAESPPTVDRASADVLPPSPGRFTILYAGNLGRTHDLKIILDCVQLFRGRADMEFLFVLAQEAPLMLRQACLDPDLPIRVSHMAADRDSQWSTLALGHVVLISFRPGMAGVSVPSRMYNAMAAGKPIIAIAEERSELSRVLMEGRIGWVVAPESVSSLQASIVEAMSRPALLESMRERALAFAQERCSREEAMEQYRSVVEHVSVAR